MPASTSTLLADLDVRVEVDAPIGQMTWYGIGGRADCLVHPRSLESLQILAKRCARSEAPLRVLGSGANLLVADEGVDGVVVKLDEPAFTEIRYNARGALDAMRAGAGADLSRVLMDCVRRGLEGLSQMAGIPASVGGAIRMNAGGAYGAVGDRVHSVGCVTRGGELAVYPRSELRFEYRRTNLRDPIILWAAFGLEETDPVALRERVKEIFAYKKSTQPLAEHSAGCAFRNPVDPVTEQRVGAGKLIDEAGLKGTTLGGATISPRHANFITVQPGTRSDDVLRLLEVVQQRVLDHSGYELEPEIAIWRRGGA
ncbi:MAG: UDP-N-acetylmuramate dehydrogenase [Phycisphaerales bacterium]